MRNYCISFFILFLQALLPGKAESGNSLFFNHMTVKDGLSSNYIHTLYRDTKGFVWIGTSEGLDRFDGCEIRSYKSKSSTKKNPKPNIVSICEKENNLLVISHSDISEYVRGSDSLHLRYSGKEDNPYRSALLSQDRNTLFLGATKGLSILNKNFGVEGILLPNEYIQSLAYHNNNYLILTPNSLYSLWKGDDGIFHVKSILSGKENLDFSQMVYKNDFVYIGTKRSGVYSFNLKSKSFEPLTAIKSNIITTLFIKGSNLYVGSDGKGVECYDLETQDIITFLNNPQNKSSISSNSVYSLFIDNHDIVWVGTYSLGICYSSESDNFFKKYDSLEGNSIRSFAMIDQSRILVGTRNGLIYSENSINHIYRSGDFDFIRSNIILSLSPYKDSKYIVGTYGGGFYLYSTQTKRTERYPLSEKETQLFLNESVYGSAYCEGKLYLATLNGLFIIKDNKIERYLNDKNSKMQSSFIYSFMIDEDKIWLGTSKGICFYDLMKEDIYLPIINNIENDFRVNYIYKDSKKNIWLCSENYGLLKYTPNFMIEPTGKNIGISTDHVSGIIEDDNKCHYWISSGNGFYRYDELTKRVKSFDEKDGLATLSFCPAACTKDKNNRIYFGSEYGLVYFNSGNGTTLPANASLVITDYYVGEQKLRREDSRLVSIKDDKTKIALTKGDDLKIRLVNSNFKDTRSKTFAYRLLPIDTTWTYTNSNFLIFNNLPEGNYSVQVKCSEDDISWSETHSILDIHVKKKFIQTTTFNICLLIVFLILAYSIWYARRKLLLTLNELKNSKRFKKNKKSVSLEDEWIEDLIGKMKTHMQEEKPYINPNFAIKDLSDNIGYSTHQISLVLNNKLGLNFFDFINQYRIEAVKLKLHSDEVEALTLYAIAEKCGFNSKTSFYRIFKKNTGLTPLEYRKNYEQSMNKKK